MDFGNILSRAWQIAWKNRALWLFGILASCGSQGGYSGSGFNFNSSGSNFPTDGTLPPGMERFFFQLERSLERITPEAMFSISLAIIAIALVAVVLFSFFSVFGRVGVIKGTLLAEEGSPLNISLLAKEGYTYFWRAFGLNLILGLALFAIMAILVLGGLLFSGLTLGIGLLCFIPLVCLLIPFSMLYYVYIELANVALVTEDLGVMDSAGRAWKLMQGNWGNIILMALILILGGGLLGFFVALPIALVAIPFLFTVFAGNQDLIATGLALSGVFLLIAIPIVILLNGILRTFILSAWTLTYQELASEAA